MELQLLSTGKCLEKHWCAGAPCFHSSGHQKNPQDWTLLWNGMAIITAITLLNWQGPKGRTKTTHKSPTISSQIILLICLCVYSVIPLYQRKWGDRDLLHQSQQKHQRPIKLNLEIQAESSSLPKINSLMLLSWDTNPAFPLVMCRSLQWQYLLGWRSHITPPSPPLSRIFCFVSSPNLYEAGSLNAVLIRAKGCFCDFVLKGKKKRKSHQDCISIT